MLISELKQCIIDNGLSNILIYNGSTLYLNDRNNTYLCSTHNGVYIAYDISDDYIVLNQFNNRSKGWGPDMFVPFINDAEIHRRIKKIAVRLKEIKINKKLKNINNDFVEI